MADDPNQNQERLNQGHNPIPNLVPNPAYKSELVKPIRTMKDYSRPIVSNHPLHIVLEPAARNHELKSFHYN